MDTQSMVFCEMIRTEIMDVIKGMGGDLRSTAKNLVQDVTSEQDPSGTSAFAAVKKGAECVISSVYEFSGDVCEAAVGSVEGAIEGAREAGMDAAEAASAAATGAVTAGYEINPAVGTKIKKVVNAAVISGVKVVVIKPVPVWKRPSALNSAA